MKIASLGPDVAVRLPDLVPLWPFTVVEQRRTHYAAQMEYSGNKLPMEYMYLIWSETLIFTRMT